MPRSSMIGLCYLGENMAENESVKTAPKETNAQNNEYLAEIRDILAKQYDVKWYKRMGRGMIWGLGFGLGSFIFLALFVWMLSFAIQRIEFFPGVKSYVSTTIDAIRLLLVIRD